MSTHTSFTPDASAESAACKVQMTRVGGRFSLRARGDLSPLNKALGVSLPTKIGQRVWAEGGVEALCLGPDEWTIVTGADDAARVTSACAEAYKTLPHSLTDITGREYTAVIEGPRAAELLTLGCPRDIATIKVGEARRTVFDGQSVVIWCDTDTKYRMDIWNSFAPHIFDLLATGTAELAAEAA